MSWNPDFHGNYNKWDADPVIAQPTAAAKQAVARQHLTAHLRQLGITGVPIHLLRKAQLFLATGTFDSFQINSVFDREPLTYRTHQTTLDWWLANWAQLSYLAMLLVNLAWGWRQWRLRRFAADFLLGGLFFLGLTAFHVIFWETEERYALPLLPLLLAGTAASFRLPARVAVRQPRQAGHRLAVGLSLLLLVGLVQNAPRLIRPVTQTATVVSQNEGRYYQDHLITLALAHSVTQPFTASTAFNQFQIDPSNQRIGQVTLSTAAGDLVWQSDQQVALDNVQLPQQPAGRYQLTVTNQLAQPMHLTTAPATYPLLPQSILGRPHQYLRFLVTQTTATPLLSPQQIGLFAGALVFLTAGLGQWYRRWWQKVTKNLP